MEQYLNKETLTLALAVAWGLSETLALIPAIKSNGIFHAIYLGLAKILGKEIA
jgi:hypothetical protein